MRPKWNQVNTEHADFTGLCPHVIRQDLIKSSPCILGDTRCVGDSLPVFSEPHPIYFLVFDHGPKSFVGEASPTCSWLLPWRMGFLPRESGVRTCLRKCANPGRGSMEDTGTWGVLCRNVSGSLCHQEPQVAGFVFHDSHREGERQPFPLLPAASYCCGLGRLGLGRWGTSPSSLSCRPRGSRAEAPSPFAEPPG